jgi:hypothetical protein
MGRLIAVISDARVRIALIAGSMMAIGAFAAYRLASGSSSVGAQFAEHWPLLALAIAAFASGSALLGCSWIVISDGVSRGGDPGRLAITFAYTWLGRYVPGSAPFFAGKVLLGARFGYSKRGLTTSTVIESVLEVMIATAIGASMLLVTAGDGVRGMYTVLAIAPAAGLVALHPVVLRGIIDAGLRVARRAPLPDGALPSFGRLAVAAALITATQLINGLGMLALLHATADAGWRDAALAAGALSLAGVLGIIIVLAPAGLGVRDGALTGLLTARFAVESATLAAVLLRTLTVISDLLLCATALVCDLLSGGHVLRTIAGRSEAAPRGAGIARAAAVAAERAR